MARDASSRIDAARRRYQQITVLTVPIGYCPARERAVQEGDVVGSGRGLLVAIEGPKAAGKTSLITKLRGLPSEREWLYTKEPTPEFDLANEQAHSGSDLAALIRRDRERHVNEVIEPAVQDGAIVVTDRYILSGLVFQSIDGVALDTLEDDNRGFPRPDITLILLASSDELRRRKVAHELETRISSLIDERQESQLYVEYASRCRADALSQRIIIGYNEKWTDCDANAEILLTAIRNVT